MTQKPSKDSPEQFLKAPFPFFGGKRKIAERIWTYLSGADTYIEPFAGSLAVLLGRPTPVTSSETVNDWSCLLINAWRAIQKDPEGLAELLVGPVSEVDTESQHWSLVTNAKKLRDQLGDPDAFDLKLAAYYIKGANEWIGSGWAAEEGGGPWSWSLETGWQKKKRGGNAGTGINRQLPHLGNAGKGINRQLPHLGDAGKGIGQYKERLEWVMDWLSALRDRLCRVRIACGDFERVLSPSVTTKHGISAVFLDPPYDGTEYVYGNDTPVSQRVRDWCLEKGSSPDFKIVLAGRGAEHDALLAHGWIKEVWTANRGYSNEKNEGRLEEAIWISPFAAAGAAKTSAEGVSQ